MPQRDFLDAEELLEHLAALENLDGPVHGNRINGF